ncbi:hypothetical protein KJ980_03120 [Patescibacteria group bacterium]|nr:hypothetical protein [Patescibacteria group bacterium]MBU4017202.1 hypothetical protein [Patescibacteria group bacterium]MBU4098617.1 hypothetical protein [Patescibacteria group bacterium]
MNTKLPKNLQAVLWSRSIDSLNIDKDKTYIIHQIFSHGRMEDILWLFRTYTASILKEVFSSHAYKDYDAARFHFTKNYLLGLKKTQLNEKNYVKNIPRDIR